MRRCWVVFCGGTLLVCAVCAQAAKKPIKDPQVIIAGGTGSLPVGSLFSFISPSGTSPITLLNGSPCLVGLTQLLDCIFKNGTDSRWSSLTLTITPGGQTGPFTCLALAYFSGCFFNSDGTQLTFFGGRGLPAGGDFLIAVLLWQPGTTFSIQATLAGSDGPVLKRKSTYDPLPPKSEPPSVTLFLKGHVAWDQWRRLQPAA
jgi:hypothetical protein